MKAHLPMEKVYVLCLIFALSVSLACAGVENVLNLNAGPPLVNGQSSTFHKSTCPKLKPILEKQIKFYLNKDNILDCLHFHDCFVQGCDDIKERVEKACGVIVSRADITALAARDSVSGAFLRAWYAACRKSSAMLLVPDNKKFVVISLLFQGPCKPAFIFKVDGMISATQIPESRKNSNKWLQLAKEKSFTLIGRGLIDVEGEKLWAGQCMHFNQQRSVAAMENVVKGRKLLEPSKPKPTRGQDPLHD